MYATNETSTSASSTSCAAFPFADGAAAPGAASVFGGDVRAALPAARPGRRRMAPRHKAVLAATVAVVAAACLAAFIGQPAQAQAQAFSGNAAAGAAPDSRMARPADTAAADAAPADSERVGFMRQTAGEIARLRQQQALVEAQLALAKVKAELVKTNAPPPQPLAPAPLLGLSAAPAPVVTAPGTASLPGGGGSSRDEIRLVGVSGTPVHRIATISFGDNRQQQADVGSVFAGWRVQEVRLSDVVLVPAHRAGSPVSLGLEGKVQGLAPESGASAAPATHARRSSK